MLVGVAAFLGSEVVLSPVVSGCLPSCGGWVLVGVAASRTKIFRNQNHGFQSKFAYCKLFGVYAGLIGEFSRIYFSSRFLFSVVFLHCAFWVVPDVRLAVRKNAIFSARKNVEKMSFFRPKK